jgi:hypothetical protein
MAKRTKKAVDLPDPAQPQETVTVTEKPADQPEAKEPVKVFQTSKSPEVKSDAAVPFYDKVETTKVNDGQTLHLVRRNGTPFWWSRAMIILTSRQAGVEVIGDGTKPKSANSLEFPSNTQIQLEPATKGRCRGCL